MNGNGSWFVRYSEFPSVMCRQDMTNLIVELLNCIPNDMNKVDINNSTNSDELDSLDNTTDDEDFSL